MVMSTTYCLLFVIYCLSGIVNSQCKWNVLSPGGVSNTFDLTCAIGKEFTTIDPDGSHDYLFSLCDDGAICNGSPVMAKQTSAYDPDLCYVLGRWDENIQPTYESDNGGRWFFEYANGADDCGNTNRTWTPIFQCDSAEWDVDVVWEMPSCVYGTIIHTKYACTGNTQCSNATTTTTPPQEECIWNIGDNTLNLTVIEGLSLYGISDDDSQQIYSLLPCSNNINCNGDFSMITVGTISNCMQIIARWDDGLTQPKYSNNYGGEWQFVYTNGDDCSNGLESVVTVFWNCNPFAGTGRISAAKEIGPCIFEIQIDSNLACS